MDNGKVEKEEMKKKKKLRAGFSFFFLWCVMNEISKKKKGKLADSRSKQHLSDR
jgi:hypothetical protein